MRGKRRPLSPDVEAFIDRQMGIRDNAAQAVSRDRVTGRLQLSNITPMRRHAEPEPGAEPAAGPPSADTIYSPSRQLADKLADTLKRADDAILDAAAQEIGDLLAKLSQGERLMRAARGVRAHTSPRTMAAIVRANGGAR